MTPTRSGPAVCRGLTGPDAKHADGHESHRRTYTGTARSAHSGRPDQTDIDAGIRRSRIRRRNAAEPLRRELATLEAAGQLLIAFTEPDPEHVDADDLAAVVS